jgi:hypothetical protein
VTGFLYDPTLTSITGTHYAFRATSGSIFVTQGIRTIAWTPALDIRAGNHTGITAGTELNSYFFAGPVQEWATGALANQYFTRFYQPTINFVGASTATSVANIFINGAPLAGTNATLTNTYALFIQGGGVAAGSVNGYGLSVEATSSATNNYSAKFLGGNGIIISDDSQSTGTRQTISVTQAAHTGGSHNILVITGGAHTAITAGTTSPDVLFGLNRTQQWATGALSVHRSIVIGSPLISFVGSSTATDVSTLVIQGGPISSTNATITNSSAFKIETTNVSGAGTVTNSYGLYIEAMTGATNNYAALFDGDIRLGSTLSGATRTMSISGADTNVGLVITTKGIGTLATPALVDLGTTSLAGDRTLEAKSSSTDSHVEIRSKGVGTIRLVAGTTYLGNSSLAGASRDINVLGSATDVGINLDTKGAGELVFKTGASERLRITSDGRLYGTALHNNAGVVTGTTNQYVASGTYTPTLTNTTNVAASTAYLCQWIRVGNVVTVSGKVDIDITTTLLASDLGMTLPIASAFTNERDCGGTAVSDAEQTANIRVKADATNDRAQFVWTGQVGVGNLSYSFTFTYLIL